MASPMSVRPLSGRYLSRRSRIILLAGGAAAALLTAGAVLVPEATALRADPGTGGTATLFSSDTVPGVTSFPDTAAVELGVRFASEVPAVVTGVRFYQGEQNTGPHTASLWTATGDRLATGTVTPEPGTGWRTLTFDQPVPLTPGTTYVASYFAPQGGYAVDRDFFTTPLNASPLTAEVDAGVYSYGPHSAFPTDTYRSNNYYVTPVVALP